MHVGKTPDDECFAKVFWQHDTEDVRECDVVLVYVEADDHLRGALIEAGMGIAFEKDIIVVGEHPDYGTWQFHPWVHRVKDLDSARILLRALAMDVGDH
jgi:nucleoside 2-deoxyribosyltransferase